MGVLQAATAVAGLGLGIAGQRQANKQAKQMYQLQTNELLAKQSEQEQAAKTNLEIIQKTAEEREKQRRNLLKAELAKRRAIMGAAGVGGGGSSTAVQYGLAKKTDNEAEYDLAMDKYRIDEIVSNLNANSRKNLMNLTSLNYSRASDDLFNFNNLKSGLTALNSNSDIF